MPTLLSFPLFRAFTTSGTLAGLAGGKLYAFKAGTATPKPTYKDSDLTVPHAHPIVLDAVGQEEIWLESGGYKFDLFTSDNVQVEGYPVDNYQSDTDGGSSTSVENVAELKALTSGAFDYVDMAGYYANGDGGGGRVYWDSTNTDTPDDGVTFQGDDLPATGRWVRIFDGDVSVLYFGAKGDYIVSGAINGSAQDNTTTFNNTFAYCLANEKNARLPEGAYLVTGVLTCAVGIIGDQKGKIEDNAVYGAAVWRSSVVNFSGSCIVWGDTSIGLSTPHLQNVSGADSFDVKYVNITFYSTSDDALGAGVLLVNDSAATGTEFNFGPNSPFQDCNIVDFGTAIKYNIGDTWHIDSVNFIGCQQPLEMGNSTEKVSNVTASQCSFISCGDTSTAFIKLDNVAGFLFDRCKFEKTSQISLRIATNKGLSFTNCYFDDISLNSAGDFITVVSTAGYDVDAVSLTRCISGGSMGDINLIQGTNVSTLFINECDLTGCTVPLGTSYVSILKIGYVNIDGTSGTGIIDVLSSTAFQALGIAFDAAGTQRRIELQTEDASDTESLAISGGGDASAASRGGIVEVFGDDHGSSAGKIILTAGTGGAATGDIELTTDSTAEVKVTGSLESTSTTTGSLTAGGGIGAVKNIRAGGVVSGDGLEINTIYTETMSGGGSGTSGSTTALAGVIANAPTTLTITATSVLSTSLILFTLERSAGLTDTLAPCITAINSGASFVVDEITAGATIHWMIINPT